MARPLPETLARVIREVADDARRDADAGPELLKRFVANRDEETFRSLVRLYAAMVWGVCRRITRSPQDAEDAFQATFIVLARRADRVVPCEKLSAWLFGVSTRCALGIRTAAARRREVRLAVTPEIRAEMPEPSADLRNILDEELDRLPEGLRHAVVLCYVEGRSHSQAARLLGCSKSTLAYRLGQATELLQRRLGRRGLAPVGGLAVILATGPAASGAPSAVIEKTVGDALGTLANGPSTVALTTAEAVIRSMASSILRRLVGVALLVSIGIGVGVAAIPGDLPSAPSNLKPGGVGLTDGKVDRYGDPLPDGAVARIGTLRFRPNRVAGPGDVVYLPDGKSLISVHGAAEVTIWAANTGRAAKVFEGPSGARFVRVSADGRRLIVAGVEQVWCWDLGPDGASVRWKWRTELKPGQSLTALALAPDSRTVAVGDPEGECTRLLDGDTGKPAAQFAGTPSGLLFTPNNRSVLVGIRRPAEGRVENSTRPNRIVVWDIKAGREKRTFDAPGTEWFHDFAVSPDGESLSWINVSRICYTVDIGTGREQASWSVSAPVFAYLPGKAVLAQIGTGYVEFRDPKTGKEARPRLWASGLAEPHAVRGPGNGIRISPDGKHLAVSDAGGVTVWDLATGRPSGPDGQVVGPVRAVAFSPDGRKVVTFANQSSELRVWNAATGEPGERLGTSEGIEGRACALTWGADCPVSLQSRIEEARPMLAITRWDSTTGKPHDRSDLPAGIQLLVTNDGLAPFAATTDAKRAVFGSAKDLHVLGADGQIVRKIDAEGDVMRVALSANGRVVCASTRTHQPLAPGRPIVAVKTWDVETGKPLPTTLPGSTFKETPCGPCVSADGHWLAAVNTSNAVVLTEVSSNQPGQQFSREQPIRAVAFSPDGRLLAAGDAAGSVAVWDLATGRLCRQFSGHRRAVASVAFSPDGKRLVSGGDDGTGLVWDAVDLAGALTERRTTAELCSALIAGDTATAHRLSFALVERKAEIAPVLAKRLKPAAVDAKAVRQWVADLDDERFATREEAEAALVRAGPSARSVVKEILATDVSAEQRLRLTALMTRWDVETGTAARRGVALLERIGTPECRKVLEDLAKWSEGGAVATEAAAALRRMPKP